MFLFPTFLQVFSLKSFQQAQPELTHLTSKVLDKSRGRETFLILLLLADAHRAPHAAIP